MNASDSEVTRRLDTLIRLVATALCAERPQKEKISILAGAGLAPKEIAEIVGTTPNTVSVSLSAMRRNAKPKAKKKSSKSAPPDEGPAVNQ
jgi:copper homeostasis protein CutC